MTTKTQPQRGICPVCNREMNLKADGTMRHHGGPKRGAWPYGREYRCKGADEQPSEVVDDPACTHRDQQVGVVCWPTEYEPGKSHASTYVCARPECQEDAARWVERVTGHPGVFKPFRAKVGA